MKTTLLGFLLSGLMVSSCGDKIDPVNPTRNCGTEVTGYAQHVKPLLDRECLSCHTSQSPVFTDYSTTKNHAQKIFSEMANGTMPPSGEDPTEAEVCTVSRWITQNFPQ
jgi:hypothetical protein